MDTDLETAIDRAGRERVFTRARQLGWGAGAPKFVWWNIVADLRRVDDGINASRQMLPPHQYMPE